MALVTLNLKPSEKQLKSFGLAAMIMCAVIGILFLWLGKFPLAVSIALAAFGLLTFTLSKISTKLIKPIYLTLTCLTFPIGWIISNTVMALFYYVVITSAALVFKLLNRDPLHRKYDPEKDTYWIRSKSKRPNKDYFRQF